MECFLNKMIYKSIF